jgi:hypothetical protein
MSGALLLFFGALLSKAMGQDDYRSFCVAGMLLGFSLGLIALGVRSIVSVAHWMKSKSETAHV